MGNTILGACHALFSMHPSPVANADRLPSDSIGRQLFDAGIGPVLNTKQSKRPMSGELAVDVGLIREWKERSVSVDPRASSKEEFKSFKAALDQLALHIGEPQDEKAFHAVLRLMQERIISPAPDRTDCKSYLQLLAKDCRLITPRSNRPEVQHMRYLETVAFGKRIESAAKIDPDIKGAEKLADQKKNRHFGYSVALINDVRAGTAPPRLFAPLPQTPPSTSAESSACSTPTRASGGSSPLKSLSKGMSRLRDHLPSIKLPDYDPYVESLDKKFQGVSVGGF